METLEAVIGTEPKRQLPLYDSIEPDALDSLLRHAARGGHRSDISLCFEFAGHLVTVYGTGELVVKPLDDHR